VLAFTVVLVALYGWDFLSSSSGEILGLDENVLQRTRRGGCRLPVWWSLDEGRTRCRPSADGTAIPSVERRPVRRTFGLRDDYAEYGEVSPMCDSSFTRPACDSTAREAKHARHDGE
jgi:hypothetical protein